MLSSDDSSKCHARSEALTIRGADPRLVRGSAVGRARHLGRVRELLRHAQYTEAGIQALGVDIGLGVRRPDVPVLLRALEPSEPLASLVRIFLLAQAADRHELERRLGRDLEALVRAGLLRQRAGQLEPTVQLTPWRGLLVAHDPDPDGELWPTHVSGPTPAAETLAQLIVPGPGPAMDLGTGCGLLALLLARPTVLVTATDINPAALRYARLGAELNEVVVDVREGSLFDAVGESRFQRIVSNPPFVISPDTALIFCHGGMPRDETSRRVVEGAGAHLVDGGIAVMLANWIVPRGSTWLDAVRPMVESTGCDAVILLHGVEDPLSYAVRWNGRAQYVAPDRFPENLERWLDYDREQGIEAIASGAIVLRSRTGRTWTHGLQIDGETRGAAGGHILRLLSGVDYLAGIDDSAAILATAFRLAEPHRLNQSLVADRGEYALDPATLVLDEGLGTSVVVEPDLIPVVLRLDGAVPLGGVIDEVVTGSGTAPSSITDRAIALVTTMLERGFVEPVAVAARR